MDMGTAERLISNYLSWKWELSTHTKNSCEGHQPIPIKTALAALAMGTNLNSRNICLTSTAYDGGIHMLKLGEICEL
jgi:hypothetical protein